MADRAALEQVVGSDCVFDDSETLERYASDQSFVAPGKAWCVVRPASGAEVQALVAWAYEMSEPLTPVSSPDGPRFRGDTIPSQGGVVVDLSGMNQVVNVDREDRVAIIEPGVTFSQLDAELKSHGLRAFKPLSPRRTKSVLACYLDRVPVVVPKDHWDAQDPLICAEVVFGTGDILRTGSAAGPKTVKEQLEVGIKQVQPGGPGLASLARLVQGAQGTMGIATWASVFCGLLPETEKPFLIAADDIAPLVAVAYQILRRRIGEELFFLNGFHLATIMADDSDEVMKLSKSLPSWILALNLTGHEYFPEDRIAYQEKDTNDLAQPMGLSLDSSVSGVNAASLMKILEEPREEYYKMQFKGGFQDIFFIATLDKSAGFVAEVNKVLEAHDYPANELGVYIQPTVQGSNCHCEFSLLYDPASARETDKVKNLLIELSSIMARSGAFFSRPYWPWTDMAYRMDAETTAALRKAKGIFDPKGIMNPGKLIY